MSTVQIDHCPVCNQNKLVDFMEVKDHSISKEVFQLQTCSTCTFTFTQNAPSESTIGPYYESEEYISHSDTQKSMMDKIYHKVRARMLDSKLNTIKALGLSGKRLLDVGTGTGYFLNHMKKNDWSVLGIEVNEEARKIAKDKFGIDTIVPSKLFDINEKFDVITLWHVLEHIHQLNENIAKFHSLLNEDGALIIAVPNHTSNDAKRYKDYWAAYDVPRHLWHFSPKSMETLMSKHGFELIKKKNMPFDAFYVSLLSEKYKKAGLASIKGGMAGLISNLKSVTNVDNSSSIIYIFKKRK
jgi:2-polyprenyl-3-methyl-5-hydroxy-6-metoxy-1,4-benzoquinol methylase